MRTALKQVRPLPDYRLQLTFQNGSLAIINMSRRIKTLRFSRLSSESVFATARAEGDRVVWRDGDSPFSFTCTDLLDTMLLD